MNKKEFTFRRTEIISRMLDNPDEHGIYPTTIAYAELDDLFDLLTGSNQKSGAQEIRDSINKE